MSKRLMTPADLYRLVKVGDAQISPDGKWVAYVQERLDKESDKSQTAVWLAPVTGGEGRKLTAGPADRSPRWSPDGSRIAFVSGRNGGKPKLHLIPIDGGEASLLETEQDIASAPVWSPDGSQIAFLAVVEEGEAGYPGAPSEQAKGIKVVSTFHHKQDGVGYYGQKEPRIFVLAASGEEKARQVSRTGIRCDAPTWAPDGKRLVTSVMPDLDGHRALWVRKLMLIDLESGEMQPVLEEQEFPAYSPAFSPDGKYLAFSGQAGPFGWLHDNMDLFVLDVSAGAYPYAWSQARNLSAPLDRCIFPVISETAHMGGLAMFGPLLWSPDSRECMAVFADKGDAHIFAMPVSGDNPRRVAGDAARAVMSFSISRGGTLAFSASDPVTPDEIFVLDGGGVRRITDVNGPVLAEVAVQPVEKVQYQGPDGWEMEGWLTYPAGYEKGKRYPTVLEIHGGPAGLWGNGFTTSHQVLAAAGYAVIATNPRGSQGYGRKHARGCVDDWGGKDYLDIQAGVDAVIRMGVADPDRLGVSGWSYGGYMTCWTVTQTDRFKAAIPGACVSNLHDMYATSDISVNFIEFQHGTQPWEDPDKLLARSPIRHMHKCTTPVLLLHGEEDLRCPVAQSEQVYTTLKRLGRMAVMVRYPGEPHVLNRPSHQADKLERSVAWFDHYLKQ